MLRDQRSEPASARIGLAGVMCVAAVMAACSADVSRFDAPPLGLTESNNQPLPSQPLRAQNMGDGRGYGQPGPAPWTPPGPKSGDAYAPYGGQSAGGGGSSVQVAALPPIEQSQGSFGAPGERSAPIASAPIAPAPRASVTPLTSRPAPIEAKPIATGETIEVQPGDTLYGLSRKHNVPVNEIMSANGLSSPALKPGQKLKLPVPTQATEPARTPVKLPLRKAEPEAIAAARPAAPSNWTGSYTMKAGDSLYAIARQRGINYAELQRVNGIADVRSVRPGTVLKVPADATADAMAPPVKLAAPIDQTPRDPASPAARPTVINGAPLAAVEPANTASDAPKLGAPADPAPSAAAPLASGQIDKLRWPVRGKVISGFGQKLNGQPNDGVNIAVPPGTDVLAAEAGVVAYAGSELKGYGNLVLVRHDNGWVTAYAHNDTILVQRGDRVKRGQPLAKAGKTGSVDSPQVHFELRQGSKPIDPTPHMEKG